MSSCLLQYLADGNAVNGIGGSSPQLSDANNSDTLVVGERDPSSGTQLGNSLDAPSQLAPPPRRRERKSTNVRPLIFIVQFTAVFLTL